jgi:hypothetical protein
VVREAPSHFAYGLGGGPFGVVGGAGCKVADAVGLGGGLLLPIGNRVSAILVGAAGESAGGGTDVEGGTDAPTIGAQGLGAADAATFDEESFATDCVLWVIATITAPAPTKTPKGRIHRIEDRGRG